MSRIEEALKIAVFSRDNFEKQERVRQAQDIRPADHDINILIISKDPHLPKLISNLLTLPHAGLITSDSIDVGMKSFFDDQSIEIDDYELRFTSMMLDDLCCSRIRAADENNSDEDPLFPIPFNIRQMFTG